MIASQTIAALATAFLSVYGIPVGTEAPPFSLKTTTFFIDRQGRVVERHVGFLSQSHFERTTKKLL